jgi:hypothetical protein
MFLLDSNKLTRIQDILSARLTRTDGPPVFKCDVTFKNGTADTLQTITDVLALDNTRRNPITSLTVSAQTVAGADSPAGCVVEFIGRTTGSPAAKQNITLRVDGENQITKSETFAAVEEQIERTFISPWPMVAVALSLIAVLFLALFVLGGRLQVIPTRLSSADLLQLDQLASDAKNSDDKLAFLFDAKRREIHSVASLYKPVPVESLITLSGILKTLVLLGLIGMLLGMLFCYRVNTFLWGDYGEYYETLKERRKLLRNIVVGTFVVGVIVNLLSADLWQRYHSNR